ncbi:MAG TPA: tRNA 2-thiouridine(34) synthase MnmA [Bacteroidetes bacterium]|nr:tRNA 2-thiouridine(34) synthase MnmA [Bacteroidota bacterium]
MSGKKVVVGLSGGVDSSVTAYLLKEQGNDVVGMFMRNWHDTTGLLEDDCTWEEDEILARMVAKKLDIPFFVVDLSEEYRKRVVDYMFAEYDRGRTPNPDVLCNREIKFDLFATEARKLINNYVGAYVDIFIATGHYSRIEKTVNNKKETVYRLLAGKDRNKDQSYFLCLLSQEQLAMSLFPLGEVTKPEVREIAARLDLPTASRKDSQGICFVGKVDLPVFLQQQLKAKEGKVIEISKDGFTPPAYPEGLPDQDIDTETLTTICAGYRFTPQSGQVIGKHRGAHFFTIGQRRGLNIGGKTEPLFVLFPDVKNNLLYVGQGHDHPGLNRKGLIIARDEIHWIRPDLAMQPGEKRRYQVRIRYRQPLQEAALFMREEGMYIVFEKLQRGITPGQFAAWYDGDELLGSGTIRE